ncbi:Hsp20/alpha crystallin family protein [Lyngbya confervoides]|uniref:Hsp20/alpha crystallin family protein n=1 Tax=Lyngbya confervoides BDU141951 TaxID=1574623 RepID=A0ABD4T458_9CYAN|nr:Hsp20/alpha crystallin family protein [Lyngbya confervoides]MCM1983507.1 Hsp20/alpha crystallin family protein [Lyngbya confervoides BDU141951]
MSITRWRPGHGLDRWDTFGSDMGRLKADVDRLFSDFAFPGWGLGEKETVPSAELSDLGEQFSLKLEVPGMKPEDLEIKVSENSVSISGERKSESESEEGGIVRSEFHYGKFSRLIPLPSTVKSEEVSAVYTDGILTLTLPKLEKETQKVVKVNVKAKS